MFVPHLSLCTISFLLASIHSLSEVSLVSSKYFPTSIECAYPPQSYLYFPHYIQWYCFFLKFSPFLVFIINVLLMQWVYEQVGWYTSFFDFPNIFLLIKFHL